MQKVAENKQKLKGSHFFQFRPQTQNMNFSRSCEKIFERKCAMIFSKVGSKETQGNTEESWLTSIRYFEVLVVKLTQTLFFIYF